MTTTDHDFLASLVDDIPLDLATRAHIGTSWTPDIRGRQILTEYASIMQTAHEQLSMLAEENGTTELLAAEWPQFREGYSAKVRAWLQAHSACLSTMIAGRSNFNVRRAEKRNRTADKHAEEMSTYFARGLATIRKALTPSDQPARTSDSIAGKLRCAEERHALMLKANRVIRAAAKSGEPAQLIALEELGIRGQRAIDLLRPDWGRPGFDSGALGNATAEIRRLRARLAVAAEQESRARIEPTIVYGERARLEDAPSDNRVRLYFPGKPSDEIRTALKSAGFRWTPSLGCWQAYRSTRSQEAAHRFAGA